MGVVEYSSTKKIAFFKTVSGYISETIADTITMEH